MTSVGGDDKHNEGRQLEVFTRGSHCDWLAVWSIPTCVSMGTNTLCKVWGVLHNTNTSVRVNLKVTSS